MMNNKKVVKFTQLYARETLEVLSLTRAAISMSSLVMLAGVTAARLKENMESTAGSPSSESGLKGR